MNIMPACSFRLAALASIVIGASAAMAADWQAYELPVDGRYYRGNIDVREDSPLDRGTLLRHGREMMFVARVLPGKAYTLGLRMPNKGRPRLAVTLYDRWPYEADAKSWRLKTGLTLMSNRKYIEHQWRITTDSTSSGNLLYMIVNVEQPRKVKKHRFPVYAFIVSPPVEPMREIGRGVTYRRGPSNIILHDQSEQVHVIRKIAPAERWDDIASEEWRPLNTSIANGDFRDGLNRWHVFPDQHNTGEFGVAVGKYGLRLWGEKEPRLAGVEQVFDSGINFGATTQLTLRFRIVHQTQRDGFETLDDFPLRVDLLCQRKGGQKSHVYSWAFSVSAVKNKALQKQVRVVPINHWFDFRSIAFGKNKPVCSAQKIRLAGGGIPEREVWVRRVELE